MTTFYIFACNKRMNLQNFMILSQINYTQQVYAILC